MNIELMAVSILLIIVNYGFIILGFKLFGRVGLFISLPIVMILASIQVAMQIDFFTKVLTLGNVAYASSYLITDLLGELYSKEEAKKGVYIGFFTLIFVNFVMQIILMFEPTLNPDAIANGSNELFSSVQNIFYFLPRILVASLISYIFSQTLDVYIFSKLKQRDKNKKLWLRNNASTITSQLLDNLIFTFLAFGSLSPLFFLGGSLPFSICIDIFITTYIVKLIISILDTPFMYLGVYLKNKKLINEV